MEFKNNLKYLRESKGLSQTELSKQTGLKQANISRWELGVHSPNVLQCAILSSFFDITIDELVGRLPKPKLEVAQDNDTAQTIKAYKKLTNKQKKQIRMQIYTLLGDREKLMNEIKNDIDFA